MNAIERGMGSLGASGITTDVARLLLYEIVPIYKNYLEGGGAGNLWGSEKPISSEIEAALRNKGINGLNPIMVSGAVLFVFQDLVRNLGDHSGLTGSGARKIAENLELNNERVWSSALAFAETISTLQSFDYVRPLQVAKLKWLAFCNKEASHD